jgi:uncharacterized phage protein gp47/JayE
MSNNYVDSTGLHTQTVSQLVTALETAFRTIYGPTINLNVNSPDSQMINLFAQAVGDTLDCVTQVYNSMNPDTAMGVVLDQRCAINGVTRRGASFTRTNVNITVDRPLTLLGLTDAPDAPFTVQDLTANRYGLELTTSFPSAGTYTREFISLVPGAIETMPNTITVITTITLGVTAVNNPDNAITTGTNQETDIALRFRRTASVALPSQGYLEGLTGALLTLDNVADVKVYENDTSVFDEYDIPPHSIFAVVDGGNDIEIADVIYNKRNAGCGMKGDNIVIKTMINGFTMPIKFQRPTYENLYIRMTLTSLEDTHIIDEEYIKQYLFANISYKIFEPADFTTITAAVRSADQYAVVVNGGVSSDDITYESYLYPESISSRFLISIPRIDIIVV